MNIQFVFIILFGLLVTIIKWGLIVWGVVWLVRYLKRNGEERQRFRLELGKLAEEVQRLRQKLDDGENKNSQKQSG